VTRAGRKVTVAGLVLTGLLVTLALAFFVSPEASSRPDGLNKVAADHGLGAGERPHALRGAPTAGYALTGIDDDRLSTGVAGVIGVGVVFVAGLGLFAVVRRAKRSSRAVATAGG
jgi:PDGLE domain-containing protein